MKRKTAKEILADSFRELAEQKAIDRITVTDIAVNCDYSPSTFYRQFKDKYDLIAWDYMRSMEAMLDRVGVDGYSWNEVLLDGAKYYKENKDYLANLLKHTTGLESFERYMADSNYRYFRQFMHVRLSGAGERNKSVDFPWWSGYFRKLASIE